MYSRSTYLAAIVKVWNASLPLTQRFPKGLFCDEGEGNLLPGSFAVYSVIGGTDEYNTGGDHPYKMVVQFNFDKSTDTECYDGVEEIKTAFHGVSLGIPGHINTIKNLEDVSEANDQREWLATVAFDFNVTLTG